MRGFWLCLMMASLCLGCGGGDEAGNPDAVSVSGVVKLGDQPLANARVNFKNGSHGSVGVTNEEGEFTLAQGAVPGENKVFISKLDLSGMEENVEEGMDEGQFAAMDAEDPAGANFRKEKNEIPEQYSSPEKSVLTFNVPEEGTDKANFNLQK